ncbi:hypothetical protein OZX67_05790 [Bifidobacterium sp. ESL0728]|uniref:hypothetical protein n=1 Tax=Bifidobacterium sp. ESL0728 TaxID=2983220 RepID=UPI0023F82E9D|nr:hypothetical protein [Bifidobacterium sp. ESL0728]WEV58344.1 hypothetical protein OZX67_05790 [Bifidobacterium sp. ESL0728]
MELKAWGDESILTHAVPRPRYMLGVCLCDFEEETTRAKLQEIKPLHSSKLHWREMTKIQHQASIQALTDFPFQYVVVTTSMGDLSRAERARGKCFETLLPLLEFHYHINSLIMESREKHQNAHDKLIISGLHSRQFINQLRVTFKPGAEDARLWLPDQMLGLLNEIKLESTSFTEPMKIDIIDTELCV